MINNSKNILLVDVSYCVFYKFFALRNWYKRAHPDKEIPDEYDWMKDEVFMTKYKKLFFDKITKICRKNNIHNSNIVFNIDCKHTTIWRNYIYQDYKGTRQESHKRSKFYAFGLFKLVIEELLPDFASKYNNSILKVEACEADDIVANIVIHLENERQTSNNMDRFDIDNYNTSNIRKIYILASDTDYIQLCNDNVILIDMNNNNLNNKYLSNNVNQRYYLIQKILIGDISDNIPQCMINLNFLKKYKIKCQDKMILSKKINGTEYKFAKVNKNIAEKLLKNMEVYLKFLEVVNLYRDINENSQNLKETGIEYKDNILNNNEVLIYGNQFYNNQLLIDLHKLPVDLKKKIIDNIYNNIIDNTQNNNIDNTQNNNIDNTQDSTLISL
jgi:5'-3' exonuclease